MGCEVVSVYNDEIMGKIGFSGDFLQDLVERDFPQSTAPCKVTHQVSYIYGFTQSFTQTYLFTTIIQEKEYLLFNSDRFVVRQHAKSAKKQQLLEHENVITCMDVVDKLCLVGCVTGTIFVWDIEFMNLKININSGSANLSSVGMNSKYIFAVNSNEPNNSISIFDLKTTKLKATQVIPSMEPSIKGMVQNEKLYVTVCADGVWFMRYDGAIEVTKGMFKGYPKTSMTCVDRIDDNYLLTGGVDGYIYVWNTNYECIRAIKSNESQVSKVKVVGKILFVSGVNGDVRLYNFQISKIKQEHEEITDKITYVVIDAYTEIGPVISMAASKVEPLRYFYQTRRGALLRRMIPSIEAVVKRVNIDLEESNVIIKINRRGKTYVSGATLYNVELLSSTEIGMSILRANPESIELVDWKVARLPTEAKQFEYRPLAHELVYWDGSNKPHLGIFGGAYLQISSESAVSSGKHQEGVIPVLVGKQTNALMAPNIALMAPNVALMPSNIAQSPPE